MFWHEKVLQHILLMRRYRTVHTHQLVVFSMLSKWRSNCSSSMCPAWESNLQYFWVHGTTLSQLGWESKVLRNWIIWIFYWECIHVLFVKLNIYLKQYTNKAIQILNINNGLYRNIAFFSFKKRLKKTYLPTHICIYRDRVEDDTEHMVQ